MNFKDLNISNTILKALKDKQYEIPTPIQAKAIPIAIKGKDLLGIAQTGTGKTAAFAIPVIQQLEHRRYENRNARLRALVLTPTRELAIQIGESFSDYSKYTNVNHTVIFGGVNQHSQVKALKQGIDVLVATPGRLLDLIGQGHISLKYIRHFILDEADRMLDMGFIHDVKKLLPMLPKNRQSLFFSATMPPAITKLSKQILNQHETVKIIPEKSVDDMIDQYLYYVEKPQKSKLLVSLLEKELDKSVLVFSRTKYGADKIARVLNRQGIHCEAIHGNKSQGARQRVLRNFKDKKTKIIVATDIAARGIDVENLELVINYDLPDVPETYVHRIGRTGRAGHTGTAFSFCSEDEKLKMKNIQKLTGKQLSTRSA